MKVYKPYIRTFDASEFDIEKVNVNIVRELVVSTSFLLKNESGKHGKIALSRTDYYSRMPHNRDEVNNIKKLHRKDTFPIGTKLRNAMFPANSKVILYEYEKGSDEKIKSCFYDISPLLFDVLIKTREPMRYTDSIGNRFVDAFYIVEEHLNMFIQPGIEGRLKIEKAYDSNDILFDTKQKCVIVSHEAKLVDNFVPLPWMKEIENE